MHLVKKINGSILLYSLVMMLIFSYLLDFSIDQIELEQQSVEEMKIEAEAYAMATLIYDGFLKTKTCSTQEFNLGNGDCQIKSSELRVHIQHQAKREFQFTFQLNSKKLKNLIR